MKKLAENALVLLFCLGIVGIFSIPIWWAYATVTECGWKGLFVQCRIEARPNK
jgi:hypothetical protein